MQRDFDMPNAAPQLSFGATSVGDLLTAARRAVDPGQAVDWEQLAARVGARVDELIEANQHVVSDAPSEQWLRTCCVVLASYQGTESPRQAWTAVAHLPRGDGYAI